jgi:hypothetical protein
MRFLRRLVALLVMVLPVALGPSPVLADDPTVPMIRCAFPMNHNTNEPAGSAIMLVLGWTMSTRGNLEDFVHAATVTFTIDGKSVPVTQSHLVPGRQGMVTGEDLWHVTWSFATTAPAAGQTTVWTAGITLSRPVTDHEGQELGLAGPGQPGIIPAGVLFDPAQLFCNITGT